jgi:hypothetical protein
LITFKQGGVDMHFNSSLNRVVVVLGILVIETLVMPVPRMQLSPRVSIRSTAMCELSTTRVSVIQTKTPLALSTPSGGVTAVTASAPLVSSGGSTPNISLPNVIIAGSNTAVGTSALSANTVGANNTASGLGALANNTSGSNNTASGLQALASNTLGDFNTASGVQALGSNTIGTSNTANGVSALASNTSGTSNTANGVAALLLNTTGSFNTTSGASALFSNTTGSGNTASGFQALGNNTTGNNNTASGVQALVQNTTGEFNTTTGVTALSNNTTGNNNTANGSNALLSNTTGSNNTASGTLALFNNTTGSFNTAIGVAANVASANLTNATAIGANAVVNASNKIRLGNAAVTVVEGEVPYTFTSDATKKENFRPVNGEEVLSKIGKFNLPSWNYIGHDPQEFRHYGPMAQEFFAAFGQDEVGTIGTPTTINSGDMAGILMIAVQAVGETAARSSKRRMRWLGLGWRAWEKSVTK